MPESREVHAARERERYRKRREHGIELLGGKCKRCGSTDDLHFDHIDASTKLFELSSGTRRMSDWLEELAKCQLLCADCHRLKSVEAGDTGFQRKYGLIEHGYTMYMKYGCRCDTCKSGYSVYRKDQRRRKAAQPIPG